jgi:hypothetical protein
LPADGVVLLAGPAHGRLQGIPLARTIKAKPVTIFDFMHAHPILTVIFFGILAWTIVAGIAAGRHSSN